MFHDSAEQAEADGFRPCMRCKPGILKGEEGDPQKVAVERAKEMLRAEVGGGKWSVKALAKVVGLTESHFCRVFKKMEGMTVGEFRVELQKGDKDGSVTAPRRDINMDSSASAVEGVVLPHVVEEAKQSHFETSELAQDWIEFSGAVDPCIDFGDLVDMDFDLDLGDMEGLTQEMVEEVSSASNEDDGLQFLDFNSQNLLGSSLNQ